MQYSYFSVISQFRHKTLYPFRNFLQLSLPPTLYKVETRKNSGYKCPTSFVGWEEVLDWCELENAPEMQKYPKTTFVQDCRLKQFNLRLNLMTCDIYIVIFKTKPRKTLKYISTKCLHHSNYSSNAFFHEAKARIRYFWQLYKSFIVLEWQRLRWSFVYVQIAPFSFLHYLLSRIFHQF